MSLTIRLAMPPSVNHVWRMGNNRMHKNRIYAAWMNTAAWTVKQKAMQAGGTILGDVKVRIGFWPRNRKRDIDNMLKGICDALVRGGAIEDDNRIIHISAEWREFDGDPTAHVQVERA